jgi:hypothetical protein
MAQPSIFLLSWAKTIRPLAVIKTPTPIFSMSVELLPPSARMTVRNCNAFLTKGRSSNCPSLRLVLFSVPAVVCFSARFLPLPHHTPAGDPTVTQGTAVETVQAGGCYVLGVSLLVF